MMRWWLDRGVDGFRMDVINFISKVPGLPDGPQAPGAPFGDSGPATRNGPRIHEFLAEMRREVFDGRQGEFLTVGEMPGATLEEARLYTDPARGEVDMIFQFEHVELDSHDQPRAVSRFGDDDPAWRVRSAKVLGTVLHLHRGTPYVYQGEELGTPNSTFATVDDFRDIESVNYARAAAAAGADPGLVLIALRMKSRDNARQPVDWIEAAAQVDDPDSVFAHYRALIALRHNDRVVALGDFTLLAPDHPRLWAFTRSLDGVRLLVLANLSREDVDLDAVAGVVTTDLDGAELVLGTHRDPAPSRHVLRGWEAVVHRLPPSP
jgi:oligo-1,6-glucosidase